MKVLCSACGLELDRPPSRIKMYPTQFCGTECHDAYRRRRVARSCAICGAVISMKASVAAKAGESACSRACLAELQRRNVLAYHGTEERRHATCHQCGTAFERKPSQLEKYATTFCSRACKNAHPPKRTGEWIPCVVCGAQVWRTASTRTAHVFCGYKCAGLFYSGVDDPSYTGGVRPPDPDWKPELRQIIRERDGNRCQSCGITEDAVSGHLSVHHIDWTKSNHSPENLITLCPSCHTRVHDYHVFLIRQTND